MPKHIAVVHSRGYHDEIHGCQICDGGLFVCEVCGGFEGSLATDCPGNPISEEQQNAIYSGKIDFIEGKGWCLK